MSMCISTVQARIKCAPRGSQALGVRHFDGKFSHERALVEILLDSCLRVTVQVLFTEDLVDILVRSFLRGPCLKALVEALGRFLYLGFVRSAPAAAGGPFMMILCASPRWSRSFTSPCGKLLWRSS